jgi:hypothetical protein
MDRPHLGGREWFNVAAISIHEVNSLEAVADQNERDLLAVGRPRRVFMVSIIASQLHYMRAVHARAEQLFFSSHDRDEDHLFTIR